MGKGRTLRRALPLCLPVALLAMPAASVRAEWKFTPTVDLRGTYTDNVALEADDRKQGGFVAEVTPGFTLLQNTPRLKARAAYQLHYYGYDDGGREGARHLQSSLTSELRSILVDDLFFLEGSANVGQQPISVFGPLSNSNGNGYAGANQETVKSWRVSPFMRHSFGASATAILRYSRDSVSAGDSGLSNSEGDSLMFNLNSGPLFRRIGWSTYASYQRLHDRVNADTGVKMAGVGLRYNLSDSFSLTTSGGYDEYDYQTVGQPIKGKNWSVGFDWTPSQRSSVRATVGKRNFGDSYFLDAKHRSRRSVWSINYSDAVTTTRDSYLLPATIDTSSVIDRLFTADIPDPVARRIAVEAYIRATGLPSALAESVNYFSNRYVLQRSLQASSAFNSARSTLVLSVFRTRREALSAFESDGSLSGPASGRINDDVTQTGASALFNLRLTSRSSVNLSLTSSQADSNSISAQTRYTALRLALTRQFSPRLTGSAEVRRTSGNIYSATPGYKENAMSASLSLKL